MIGPAHCLEPRRQPAIAGLGRVSSGRCKPSISDTGSGRPRPSAFQHQASGRQPAAGRSSAGRADRHTRTRPRQRRRDVSINARDRPGVGSGAEDTPLRHRHRPPRVGTLHKWASRRRRRSVVGWAAPPYVQASARRPRAVLDAQRRRLTAVQPFRSSTGQAHRCPPSSNTASAIHLAGSRRHVLAEIDQHGGEQFVVPDLSQ